MLFSNVCILPIIQRHCGCSVACVIIAVKGVLYRRATWLNNADIRSLASFMNGWEKGKGGRTDGGMMISSLRIARNGAVRRVLLCGDSWRHFPRCVLRFAGP